MESDLVKGLEKIRDEPGIPINLKVNRILKVLQDKGYMYVQKLEPAWMSVHPDNRSGMMVNSHDVREKGLHALQLGFDEKKLNESYCFELSGNLKQRAHRLVP